MLTNIWLLLYNLLEFRRKNIEENNFSHAAFKLWWARKTDNYISK